MIWLCLALVAACALAPLAWFVWRGGQLRGRRDAALALHRAQLGELDRDLAQGRVMPAEHAAAKLEVQRRLLAEAEASEAGPARSSPMTLFVVTALVPAVALLLYVGAGGAPNYAARQDAASQAAQASELRTRDTARDEVMVGRLREALAKMDSHTDTARRGYVMLGRAELSLGHLPEAAEAWRQALAQHFEPTLGAETAEVITEAEAHVTPEAAGLFRRALSEAPPDAPWRQAAEKRVAEAGKS